ncbi:RNA exonuclease 5-like isoform X2 [Watersipora subatra]|uniref:RNA exonuclease 5-like isoform X2 n=1 Tax=Watersipora subatra TaxID=2589382 RepID=UPI00355B58C9
MIARLEEQMDETSARAKRLCDDFEYAHGHGDASSVEMSYRNLMSKRRRMSEALKLPQFYIDQPYLSKCRHKNLLYDGHAPALTAPIALQTCQVQQLIMYSMLGRNSLYRPRWCSIQNITGISQLLILLLDGWSWLDVTLSQPSAFHQTLSIFSDHAIRMVSPKYYGGEVEDDLFMVPLPPEEVANKQSKIKSTQSAKTEIREDDKVTIDMDRLLCADSFSRTLLLLPFSELITEGFPVPGQLTRNAEPDCEEFVFSKSSYGKVNDSSAIFAVDCEMVATSDHRLSLASLCVVDESLKVVYKRLVKPDKPITDYVTRYSGMTAEIMADVTTTLKDVQRDLQNLLPVDAILCGHSLNNDLAALRLYHPYVIDTSVCYNLKTLSKSSLKRLAIHFLRKEIQNGSAGHCPEEDAVATMMLVLLKLKLGYSFGNIVAGGMMATPDDYFCKMHQERDTNLNTSKHEAKKSAIINTGDSCHRLQQNSGTLVTKSLEECKHSSDLSNSPDMHSAETNNLAAESQVVSPLGTKDCETLSSSATPSTNMALSDVRNTDYKIIPGCEVFSRKHIPQLEVNMFDLVGHQDKKTADICSNNMVMRSPQNDQSVCVHCYTKEKQVLQQTKRSINDGKDVVYCSLAAPKLDTPAKERAIKTDTQIAKLWKKLPVGGLCCLILGGTEQQHGAFMFAVKKHESGRNTSSHLDSREEDDSAVCSK